MDIDVASALNCLTAREKAVLVEFLQLSRDESGENMAQRRFGRHIDRAEPAKGLSPDSN